jgi:RNA polymerase sigma factor (sigma-70 family)
MSTTAWASLRELLVAKYDDFRQRLARRLGSEDLALEALHETYLQLNRDVEHRLVHNPESYLYGIALNMAATLGRVERRFVSKSEIEAAIEMSDQGADQVQAVEAIFELEALERALRELPPRRRAIFFAARVQQMPIRDIAARLGLSTRSVEMEIKRSLEHCARRIGRKFPSARFGPPPPGSTKQ